jgi:hypothetical protein
MRSMHRTRSDLGAGGTDMPVAGSKICMEPTVAGSRIGQSEQIRRITMRDDEW